jgi:hypothetical protein
MGAMSEMPSAPTVTVPNGAGLPSHTAVRTALFGTAALNVAVICRGAEMSFSPSAGLDVTSVVSA